MAFKIHLQSNGYLVNTVTTLKEARVSIKHTLPALICSDFDLQDRAVMELLNKIHSRNVQIPFIISSCHEKEDYEQEAFSHGATLCLDKIQTSLVGKTLLQYAHKYCRKTK